MVDPKNPPPPPPKKHFQFAKKSGHFRETGVLSNDIWIG